MLHVEKISRIYQLGNQIIHTFDAVDLDDDELSAVGNNHMGFGWYHARKTAALDPIRALHDQ